MSYYDIVELTGEERHRFWTKVNGRGPMSALGTQCWVWTGSTVKGCGNLRIHNHVVYASRVAWLLATGKWPTHYVCHRCDNPLCVRFSHLFDGTQAENMADAVAKGRRPRGEDCSWAVVTPAQVLALRAAEHPHTLGREMGIHRNTVQSIVNRRRWKWLP